MIGIGKNLFKSNVKVVGGASTDPDAQAFITAAGITDATQKSAVNQLVLDLKIANIWTKMKAIYPIVGGVASSHAVNLKQPGTYNLSFSTGWTHASTGMTPNGTSAYANTSLTPSTVLQLNSTHLSFYSRTESALTNKYDIGAYTPNVYNLIILRDGTLYYNLLNTLQGVSSSVTNSSSLGFFNGNRTASNVDTGFRNGTKILSGTSASSSRPTVSIFIGALNSNGTPTFYSPKQCAFASIGDGLTDAEAANFYTAVNTYQTTLGRNV
jgi:hypothetical protein